MGKTLLLLLSAATLFAADDPWTKVKDLKSGGDVQIFRKGAPKPLEAKLDEVRDDAVVVLVKNEQKSIPKEDIDRLDYRPKGRTRTGELSHATSTPDGAPPAAGERPGTGIMGGIKLTKPSYDTVYRRP
jgi:hypothetical protein